MGKCCVRNCKSQEGRNGAYVHCFPADKKLRVQWLHELGYDERSVASLRVCHKHFVDEDYRILEGYQYHRRLLRKGAIPSKNIPRPYVHLTRINCLNQKRDVFSQSNNEEELEEVMHNEDEILSDQLNNEDAESLEPNSNNFCCVVGCPSQGLKADRRVVFYDFPELVLGIDIDEIHTQITKRRKKWIEAINRDNWEPDHNAKICSRHFINGKPSPLSSQSDIDWIPSLNLRLSSCDPENGPEKYLAAAPVVLECEVNPVELTQTFEESKTEENTRQEISEETMLIKIENTFSADEALALDHHSKLYDLAHSSVAPIRESTDQISEELPIQEEPLSKRKKLDENDKYYQVVFESTSMDEKPKNGFREYKTDEYWECFYQKLVKYRTRQKHCDVGLRIGQDIKVYKAHALVLSAASPFFEELLSNPMHSNGRNLTIRLPEYIDVEGLAAVLKYMYTGRLVIADENIFSVYKLAWLLRMEDILRMCRKFIRKNNEKEINEKYRRHKGVSLETKGPAYKHPAHLPIKPKLPSQIVGIPLNPSANITSNLPFPGVPLFIGSGNQRLANPGVFVPTLLPQQTLLLYQPSPQIMMQSQQLSANAPSNTNNSFTQPITVPQPAATISSACSNVSEEEKISKDTPYHHRGKLTKNIALLKECNFKGEQLMKLNMEKRKQATDEHAVTFYRCNYLLEEDFETQTSGVKSVLKAMISSNFVAKVYFDRRVKYSHPMLYIMHAMKKAAVEIGQRSKMAVDVECNSHHWRTGLFLQARHIFFKRNNVTYIFPKNFPHRVCDLKELRKVEGIMDGLNYDWIGDEVTRELLECEFCNFRSEEVNQLAQHISSEHNEHVEESELGDKYVCNLCKAYKYRSLIYLYYHKHIVHNCTPPMIIRKFCCGLCPKIELRKMLIIHHQQRMHGVSQDYACIECGSEFKTVTTLKSHVNSVHVKNFRWRCRKCGLSFYRKSTLITHMRTHTTEKPYKCKECPYATVFRGGLKSHMLKIHDKKLKSIGLCGSDSN